MAAKSTAVFGMYPHRASFEYALSALKIAGFRDTQISALLQQNFASRDIPNEKSMYATKTVPPAHGSEGVIGSLLGWMAETRAFVIGNGSFLIAGPLIATLAGSRADAQVQVSGLTEALLTLGIPEKEAKRYRGRINDGGILLSVHCDGPDWINKAKDSLLSTGAEDICFMNESTAD